MYKHDGTSRNKQLSTIHQQTSPKQSSAVISSLVQLMAAFFKQSTGYINLAAAALFSGLLFVLPRTGWWKSFAARINGDAAYALCWRMDVLLVPLAAGCCFVLVMRRKPTTDQFEIFRAASQLAHHNDASLAPGGYLNDPTINPPLEVGRTE